MHRSPQGFTILELLVVIAIIGLLASIIMISLSSARAKARDTSRRAAVEQIRTALELYVSDHQSYPLEDSATDLAAALAPVLVPAYMPAISYDMTNISGPVYYRPASMGDSYLIWVSLETPTAPGAYGCRAGVGPVVGWLYPGSPRC